ncbi:nucleoside triphosphate pyrophosphohydrolase [Magnetospirillum molischianum]|uniref:Nucleoside triphosphate pyrophosphohydrolase n=1 Tax=Magnetospirillum molischianum DSM 120 TaxID=1150626 RepID=H8FRC5_MAGML|nr:nucleoside triphosphate pyrophosphohydrolase [Magnetospirillum molischianum]CCG40913.1 Nucleoside triphosphate pyrophosphohydrolase [Magnetospirillum molischianum DSM 120]
MDENYVPPALTRPIDRLLGVMARLRDPERGCSWDRAQNWATIAPFTIEEAYEVADAIARNDSEAVKEELGDLLFQVVFQTRIGEEKGHFDFETVAEAAAEKMIRRHPHLFAGHDAPDPVAHLEAWEEIKARERADAGGDGVLDGIARALPPMTRALKLQKRAARVGFDWDEPQAILDKLAEEAEEVAVEIRAGSLHDRVEDEIGDLLFVCVNLARKLSVDPERALGRANDKFERRFRYIENALRGEGRSPALASLDEMEALWQAAKRLEPSGGGRDG